MPVKERQSVADEDDGCYLWPDVSCDVKPRLPSCLPDSESQSVLATYDCGMTSTTRTPFMPFSEVLCWETDSFASRVKDNSFHGARILEPSTLVAHLQWRNLFGHFWAYVTWFNEEITLIIVHNLARRQCQSCHEVIPEGIYSLSGYTVP